MPFFDVRCEDCEVIEEQLLKINTEPTECRQCGSNNIVKLIGAPALRFKGKDFYISEYKRGGDKRDSLTANNKKMIYGDGDGD